MARYSDRSFRAEWRHGEMPLVGHAGSPALQHRVTIVGPGGARTEFRLATNERFKDKNDTWHDRTEWHSVVAWQRLAEIVGEYVRKGSKLYIEGKVQTSSWEDGQSGERKYRTEIVARDIVLLGAPDNREEARAEAPSEESNPEPVASGIADSDLPF